MLVDYKQKCQELQQRLAEVEELNEVATLALSRTRAAIRRLRLEHAILLERVEERALAVPEGLNLFEEMACPPNPILMNEALGAAGMARIGVMRRPIKKKTAGGAGGGAGGLAKHKLRDPSQPKRPTNAYLIFCDLEKERVKREAEAAGVTGDLLKLLTEAWRKMSDEARKPFYKLYEDDRLRYQREMAEFNDKKGDGEPAAKRVKVEEEETPALQDTAITDATDAPEAADAADATDVTDAPDAPES